MKKVSSKQEVCKKIEKSIKEIKIQFKATEQKIQASGIPCIIVDVTKLIQNVCLKNGVKEDTIRRVAGWENLRTGNSRIDTKIPKDED